MHSLSTKRIFRIAKAGITLCAIASAYFIATLLKSIAFQGPSQSQGLFWRTLLADEPDDADKDCINTLGAFNHRTEKFDDGTDPYGSYDNRD